MSKEKTHIQRLQSRIRLRSNCIADIDREIAQLLEIKYFGFGPSVKLALAVARAVSRDAGKDQKLDKELFQMLLDQERSKRRRPFRSSYPPMRETFHGATVVIGLQGLCAGQVYQ